MTKAPIMKQLETAGHDIKSAEAALAQARAKRHDLVTNAADSGIPYRAIAAAVGLSPAGVVHVLATPQEAFIPQAD